MRAKEFITEYKVDNKEGLGAVPHNQQVDHYGIKVMMKPSTFLKLAFPLNTPISVDHIVKHLKNGGSLGAPFLDISIPREWEDGDMSKPAIVSSHEGRNRMMAIQKVEGDNPVEVHLFFRNGLRSKDITPKFIETLRGGMVNQQQNKIIDGDLFT